MPYKVMITEAPRKRIVKRLPNSPRVMTEKRIIMTCPDCGDPILTSLCKEHWARYCTGRRMTQLW
jgi:hypothetical protein